MTFKDPWGKGDPLFAKACLVVQARGRSVAILQSTFNIGFNRATALVQAMPTRPTITLRRAA
jgi:DNA segregation ATPase FtsK/SpoIIIE-like protein